MKWINVKDRLPEYGQQIIGLWNWKEKNAKYEDNVATYQFLGNDKTLDYWMPLPEAPEKDNE